MSTKSNESSLQHTFMRAAALDRVGMGMLRFGLIVVLLWIGSLKFVAYEAESIVPLIANNPVLSRVYHFPAPEYRDHMMGGAADALWHRENRTYLVSRGLGIIIVCIGILIALYPRYPQLSACGSLLLIAMSLTTLSFLITTPEAWQTSVGSLQHGFPYLSGVGRLIIKDAIMLGAAVVTLAGSAEEYLRQSS